MILTPFQPPALQILNLYQRGSFRKLCIWWWRFCSEFANNYLLRRDTKFGAVCLVFGYVRSLSWIVTKLKTKKKRKRKLKATCILSYFPCVVSTFTIGPIITLYIKLFNPIWVPRIELYSNLSRFQSRLFSLTMKWRQCDLLFCWHQQFQWPPNYRNSYARTFNRTMRVPMY